MGHPVDTGDNWKQRPATPIDGAYPNHSHFLEKVRRMRILIVDPSQGSAALLQAVLKKGGFSNIISAQTGADALEQMRISLYREPISALLLCFNLPDMDGQELCRTLRAYEEWAGVPVIMLSPSALWEDDAARAAYDAGATDILYKPVRSVELLPRLISAMCLKEEWELRRSRETELVTELAELKVLEARLQYLVAHDDLTGLHNRRQLEQSLELATQNAREHKRSSALLYLDLDQFKVINNSEGHSAGDHLLIQVANSLRQHIGPRDTLAHISSDEFAILLSDCSLQAAMSNAERLRRRLDGMQFVCGNKTYQIGATIGVAMIDPAESLGAGDILARADQACFSAKRHGRNLVHLYNRDDAELLDLRNNAQWLPVIRDALANDRFRLVFQPIIQLTDNHIHHYEVLTRMLDTDGEVIDSMEFIPAAERMGLIHEIDRWVIVHAIAALRDLPAQYDDVCLNINLSQHAFQDTQLLPLVRQHLRSSNIAAERITFEITETAAIANFARTRRMVKQLRALGCRFALDDFGSGFNSYAYLKQFPVDVLKIDGAFITDLTRDPIDQALVKSMVDIAKALGKQTVAEFVSNAETLEMVRNLGIDYAQGYYISEPRELVRLHGEWQDAADVRMGARKQ
jgi:diguanylate cyclase (GGDEF)-like protein